MITYRATPGVHPGLVRFLARLLAAERRRRGTPARSRKLTPRGQAVLALRWFRDRTRTGALGRDHGISRAAACRYVDEAVDVLSAQAPDLGEALERAPADGVPYVILDGKVFGTGACAGTAESARGGEISLWYSGRKRRHGAGVQAVMHPGGLPLRTGPAGPGSVPDTGAARSCALPVPLSPSSNRTGDGARPREAVPTFALSVGRDGLAKRVGRPPGSVIDLA